jgi:hypothetical protein
MEPIMGYLNRRLREVGPTKWEAVAQAAGVAKTLPRKIAYGDRANPGVATVQPLITYFQAVDRGEIKLPVAESAPDAPVEAEKASA